MARIGPSTLVSNCRWNSLSLTDSIGSNWYTPALFTSTSTGPKARRVSSKSRRTSAALATSPWTATARPPLPVISATTRSAPSRLEA
jgi:hypothetical protein